MRAPTSSTGSRSTVGCATARRSTACRGLATSSLAEPKHDRCHRAERAGLVEMAREFARRELTPRVVALDAGDPAVIAGCWRQLVELGLDRALLEEEHGGEGLGILDLLTTIEELAVG